MISFMLLTLYLREDRPRYPLDRRLGPYENRTPAVQPKVIQMVINKFRGSGNGFDGSLCLFEPEEGDSMFLRIADEHLLYYTKSNSTQHKTLQRDSELILTLQVLLALALTLVNIF
jgi:hypothetical protein